ncbi:hypothetical protein EDD15DRAFT_2519991 [Pisolithus albus]|nr:hypothetical protein EDD15DRAFT_2519991 [Pisolithus albus]
MTFHSRKLVGWGGAGSQRRRHTYHMATRTAHYNCAPPQLEQMKTTLAVETEDRYIGPADPSQFSEQGIERLNGSEWFLDAILDVLERPGWPGRDRELVISSQYPPKVPLGKSSALRDLSSGLPTIVYIVRATVGVNRSPFARTTGQTFSLGCQLRRGHLGLQNGSLVW